MKEDDERGLGVSSRRSEKWSDSGYTLRKKLKKICNRKKGVIINKNRKDK